MSLKSPCTKVCMMDPDSGLCAGCYRTIEEIGNWSRMTEEERNEVWNELPQRKAGNSPG
ncbi:DUF1289 domain-containing protein [Leptospira bandrabouensis]|uniref:DUF1289 domain-containing protein n=1 Tax=Leptospira bandrabouensis TaxID=2484903 RepID=A0A6H3NWV9_9LEPT|nr:DUF1289 domain-containing protein [Leptospira bandrabouensis]MCG6144255.1 DUF1289 domain-containing protein [Leptospira bandrabouensis]MCG6159916.1 DUF1289 domain-containing protein [Leptospira bandrabouensis]MCG6163849.1 DUF1289 domain-containing protein [Leptospira bandrabouensis]TGN05440.1 DUF1289 domain-containing protein [Leptospira bandrabouensis]TGN15773.1 DUF1289 domain-containing protein [Leptospira bandrabouensis]